MHEEAIEAVAEYGFMTVFAGELIALLSLAVGGGLLLLYRYIRSRLRRYENKTYKVKMTSPRDHYFFHRASHIIDFQLPGIQLNRHGHYHLGRTTLFRYMLIIKIKMWKATMYAICDANYDEVSKEAMGADILDKLMTLIKAYEHQWLHSGVPRAVIDKFNQWHGMRAEVFITGINRLCTGRSYDTIKEIKSAVLDLSVSLLCYTMLDTEQNLGDLNGELDGLSYMGNKL